MTKSTALQYENRMGDVYYLQEGKTRTGKPRYYANQEANGNAPGRHAGRLRVP